MVNELNITQATATDMANWNSGKSLSEVLPYDTDSFGGEGETTYMNDQFTQQWAYFNDHPELKQAIILKAIENVGKGYTCKDVGDEVKLSLITGRGKSSFSSLLYNMEIMRHACRDAYCEIIRDEKTGMLLNLVPLNGGTIRHVYDKKGMLKRYEQVTKNGKETLVTKFKPTEIFHLSYNMCSDQCRGIAVSESLDKTLLAELEAFDNTRKTMNQQ